MEEDLQWCFYQSWTILLSCGLMEQDNWLQEALKVEFQVLMIRVQKNLQIRNDLVNLFEKIITIWFQVIFLGKILIKLRYGMFNISGRHI